jgi:hypothetical protein
MRAPSTAAVMKFSLTPPNISGRPDISVDS